ncbi:hypothetical protein BGZ79_002761, partial [Entomortierella chlamydospora]
SEMASRSPSPASKSSAVAVADSGASNRAGRGSNSEEGDKDIVKDRSGSRSRSRSRSGSRQRSQSRSRSRSRSRSHSNSRARSRSLTPRSRSRTRSRSYSRSPTPKATDRVQSRSRSRGRSLGRSRSRSLSRSRSPRSRSRSPPRKLQRRDSRSPSPVNNVALNSAVKVGNLTRNVTEGHIREIFGAYGKIKFINFPINPRFRFNMGYAEIEYETREEAQAALEGWNGGQLDGEIVDVLHLPQDQSAHEFHLHRVVAVARAVHSLLLRPAAEEKIITHLLAELTLKVHLQVVGITIHLHQLAVETATPHHQRVAISMRGAIHLAVPRELMQHLLGHVYLEDVLLNPLPEGAVDLIVVRCHDHPSEAGREPVRLVLMGQEVAVAVAV